MAGVKTSGVLGVGAGVGMVAAFIISSLFSVEGGYVNHPKDPGGATNHGITEKVARANGYTGAMQELPQDTARQIYLARYISAPGFDGLLPYSPAVTSKLVDAGVNAGPVQSIKWLQRALNALSRGGRDFAQVTADGKLGNATIEAYQALGKVRGEVQACQLVLKLIDAQQAVFYMGLSQAPEFMVGWTTARIGNVPLTWCDHFPVPIPSPSSTTATESRT